MVYDVPYSDPGCYRAPTLFHEDIVRTVFSRATVPFALLCWGLGPTAGILWAQPPAPQPNAPRLPTPPTEEEVARRARELFGEVMEHARSPERLLALFRLFRSEQMELPGAVLAALREASTTRRLPPSSRWLAGWFAQDLTWRSGDLEGAVRWHRRSGLVDDWWVVGPFDDEGKHGFERTDGPERHPAAPPAPEDTFEGKGRAVQWRRWTFDDETKRSMRGGYVSLDDVLWPNESVCAYASTTVHIPRGGNVELWVGHGGAARIWWNGVRVLDEPRYRNAFMPDRTAFRVRALRGANRILVKLCAQRHDWGFLLRIAHRGGVPLPTLRVDATDTSPVSDTAEHVHPRVLPTDFSQLEGAANDSEQGGAERLALLRTYLELSRLQSADDYTSPRLPMLAERLAERRGTSKDFLLASYFARTRADAIQWWRRAQRLAPRDPAVRLRRAELLERGPADTPPLPLYLAILKDTARSSRTVRWRAARAAARLLQRAGLPLLALETLEAEARRQGRDRTIDGMIALADAMEAAKRPRDADTLRRRVLDFVPNDLDVLWKVIGAAVARADTETALRLVPRFEGSGSIPWNIRQMALWYEQLGRHEEAWRAIEDAVRKAPDHPDLRRTMGELALVTGHDQQARSAFLASLALRPQQPDLRERLTLLESGSERPTEASLHPGAALAADRDTLLARRLTTSEHPATVLQDLTVTQIYENGLGSTFRQIAVQIHDEAAARDWKTYSIPYTPGWQRVQVLQARVYRGDHTLRARQTFDQEVGEASWRVYYDRWRRIVLLPELRPGDVLELRYRVDDVAHRNFFADYFGDLHVMQRTVPVRHAEFVLFSPPSRNIFFRSGGPQPPQHTRRTESGRRIDRWVAEDLPSIVVEPSMPGITETAAYVHVSTYRHWKDVARWYWGLIEGQLTLDDALRRVVAEAVKGAPTLEEKVRRLYEWVLDHTRYVALEFGIHGYKPYRVTDVARRGFGDCKDKASLLFALLREAGIDAHIVLLRTRRNGQLAPEPASLAAFDHAIVYVPALDLYLDGTAEHSGLHELPPMDQGTMVLHVAPNVGELRTTPILAAEAHEEAERWDLQIASDGTASGRVTWRWAGTAAPPHRRSLEAEGPRNERMREALQQRFPGIRVESTRLLQPMRRDHPLEVESVVQVPHFARVTDQTLEVPSWTGASLFETLAPSPRRRHPLELVPRRVRRITMRLRPGPTLRLSALPHRGRPVRLESPFGRFDMHARREGGEALLELRLVLSMPRIPPDRYSAFRKWLADIDRATRAPFVLERRP